MGPPIIHHPTSFLLWHALAIVGSEKRQEDLGCLSFMRFIRACECDSCGSQWNPNKEMYSSFAKRRPSVDHVISRNSLTSKLREQLENRPDLAFKASTLQNSVGGWLGGTVCLI